MGKILCKVVLILFIVIIVTFLILLIYKLVNKNYNKDIKNNYLYSDKKFIKPKNSNINFALLLTMYNIKNRNQMYMDIIKYYVDELKFPKNNLFIVDSSGNGIDESYVYKSNQLVYNQDDHKEHINTLFLKKGSSKYEILSLFLVSKKFNFSSFNYVIKLTCKYKIPELYTINDITSNSVLLLQNKTYGDYEQHSEIFGIKGDYFSETINTIIKIDDISLEHILKKLSTKLSSKLLPFLQTNSQYSRGNNSTLKILSNYENFITFIIPSLGRKTLINTINSLKNQTNKNWRAIIIFDGVKSTIHSDDNRISIIEISKTGKDKNSAGGVRNVGLKHVVTDWVGFVDDDDTLSKDYVTFLEEDISKHDTVKVVIFRMCQKNGNILPRPHDNNFYEGKVGISFAVNTKFYKDKEIYFTPSHIEDFIYLDNIRKMNIPMLISSNVAYFVEQQPINTKKYKEILINRPEYNSIPDLYCFWTGTNEMPKIRQKSLKSLKNSDFNVVLITPNNISTYIIPEHPLHSGYNYLSETGKSDYLRCYFMYFYGGGYSDIKNLEDSWIPSYKKLMNDPNAMVIGYQEVKNGVGEIGDPQIQKEHQHFIGFGCFIFKPNTNIARDWYTKMLEVMDNKYNLLKKFPAIKYDQNRPGTDMTYPYPLKWTELGGDIFHKYNYTYRNYILKGLPNNFMNKSYR